MNPIFPNLQNRYPSRRRVHNQRKGAMIVIVAVTLILLLIAALFCIDVAFMHMTKAELRTATDASARAAVEALSRTQDQNKAIKAALDVAKLNQVAGEPFILDPNDIEFGRHIDSTSTNRLEFIPTSAPFNAVRVVGRRTADSPAGDVPLFFGKIFGRGSFEPVQVATATRIDRDIALVLDRSGSMLADKKFVSLLQAVDVFAAEVKNTNAEELVSLTVYNHVTTKLVPLTSDMLAIKNALAGINATGATGIGSALIVGSDSLEKDPLQRPLAQKTIVLMTDGIHNTGIGPLQASQIAVDRNQVVHTISFGSDADQILMKKVAEKTGGRHFHASNATQLKDVFRAIALEIPVTLIE
jgi:Ca-activated chloride channel homolog